MDKQAQSKSNERVSLSSKRI